VLGYIVEHILNLDNQVVQNQRVRGVGSHPELQEALGKRLLGGMGIIWSSSEPAAVYWTV
jgi:hypothetical protein